MDQPKLDIPMLAELLVTAIDPEREIPDNLRAIILDNMELAIEECPPSRRPEQFIDRTISTSRKMNISPPILDPVRSLSEEDIQTINQVGKEHRWKDRVPNMLTPLEWVLAYYKPWIPGLLSSHIKQADPDFTRIICSMSVSTDCRLVLIYRQILRMKRGNRLKLLTGIFIILEPAGMS